MPAGAASKPTVSPPQSTNRLLYSGVTCWSGSSSRDAHGIGCLLCERGVGCGRASGTQYDPAVQNNARADGCLRPDGSAHERQRPPGACAPDAGRRRSLVPSSGFLRFVGRRAAALVLLAHRHHARRLRAHAARAGGPGGGEPRRAGGRRSRPRSRRSRSTTASTSRCPVAVLRSTSANVVQGDLGESPQTHRPGARRPGDVHPGDRRARASSRSSSRSSSASRSASSRRCGATSPIDHALRVVSLAGISMPTFWIALVALYVFFYRLGWFPGGGRLDPATSPPPHMTGPLHGRRAARRPVVDVARRGPPPRSCPRSCSPRSTSAC